MLDAPWTQVGSLQQDVMQLRQQLGGKADAHEIHALASDVASLQRTVREIRAETDSLRYRVEELEAREVDLLARLNGGENDG